MLELMQEVAEMADQVIGCCLMVANPAVDRVLDQVEDEWFPGQRRALIRAMRKVRNSGLKCTFKAVAKELGAGDSVLEVRRGAVELEEYLDSAHKAAVTPANLPRYVEMLADLNARVSLVRVFESGAKMAKALSAGEVISTVEDELAGIHGYSAGEVIGMADIDVEAATHLGGTPTPWGTLNKILSDTGGWPHGDLSLVMCAEGVGKSVLLLQSAYETAKAGGSVIFGTFEMTTAQMFSRLVIMHTGWTQRPNTLEMSRDYDDAIAELKKFDIRFYDPTRRPEMAYPVEPFVDFCLSQSGIDLTCVDYIQRLRLSRPTGKAWEDQYAVGLKLENVAKRTKSPVLIASQVSSSEGETHAKGGRGPQELSACTIEGKFDKDGNRAYTLRKVRHGIGQRVLMEMEWDKHRRCYSWG